MPSRNRWIALVALSEPQLPDAEATAGRYPADAAPRVSSTTDGAINLAWEGGEHEATANVTLVDKPIPWSQLEGPCATAWYWPEAGSAMRGHAAHLFVTLLDENPKALEQATRLTDLVVAVAAESEAVGLVWGASGAVHEPEAFTQLAATAAPDNLPLNLWIDFRVYEQDGAPGYGLFTTGLAALGHLEFEVPNYQGDPQALVGAVYNVTHYLLEKQPTLKDGEAIGLPDESQVNVREDRSMIDPEQEVIRLEFE